MATTEDGTPCFHGRAVGTMLAAITMTIWGRKEEQGPLRFVPLLHLPKREILDRVDLVLRSTPASSDPQMHSDLLKLRAVYRKCLDLPYLQAVDPSDDS